MRCSADIFFPRQLFLTGVVALTCAGMLRAQPEKSDSAPVLTNSPQAFSDTGAGQQSVDDITLAAGLLNSMDQLEAKTKLGVGDQISYRVLEDRDRAVVKTISEAGEFEVPYLGRYKVAEKTCRQVAFDLKKLLEANLYYRATVIVALESSPLTRSVQSQQMVWVVGAVAQTGPQPISAGQNLTVSQAILRAGGFGEFADPKKVRLIRRDASAGAPAEETEKSKEADKNTIIVDVKAVFNGETKLDPVLNPNDLIVVPKRWINF